MWLEEIPRRCVEVNVLYCTEQYIKLCHSVISITVPCVTHTFSVEALNVFLAFGGSHLHVSVLSYPSLHATGQFYRAPPRYVVCVCE